MRRPTPVELNELGVSDWDIWEKGISTFDYHYKEKEECYFLKGEAIISTREREHKIGKGDLVVFPEGLDCQWQITSPVKKQYRFS